MTIIEMTRLCFFTNHNEPIPKRVPNQDLIKFTIWTQLGLSPDSFPRQQNPLPLLHCCRQEGNFSQMGNNGS